MIKPGKRTKMNAKANKLMKQWCIDHEITCCELCGSTYILGFAHRQKRRYYQTIEELTDPKQWVLARARCHDKYLEWNKEIKESYFLKLRP
jgi:hypothetical protein